MNSSEESDKKINKAKSFNFPPQTKMKSEAAKRKSFNVNDAVKSLDLALVRLKKSKLVNGECVTTTSPGCPLNRQYPDMFMDVSSNSAFRMGIDNASLMSMNSFSHYELVRNLSSSLCNSEGAFSSTTCNARKDLPDNNVKNEHLEKYFRSAEMWSQKYRDGGPSTLHLNGPDK